MFIGIIMLDVLIHGSSSLKDKRSVLRSLKTRLKNKFNVSVVEVDNQELWQKSKIGISFVATTNMDTRNITQSIINFVMAFRDIEITDKQIDIYKPKDYSITQ